MPIQREVGDPTMLEIRAPEAAFAFWEGAPKHWMVVFRTSPLGGPEPPLAQRLFYSAIWSAAVRSGSRRDRQFRTSEDGGFDLGSTAFLYGISVFELETAPESAASANRPYRLCDI